ncbi:hypothetical protein KFK09_014560 [Dendrobium nobile]|uniref:Uncharacterized protein n=1 Tax=Dendrobium nobile TaxID=94219 RepID=A0A8T3B8C8_DENNO|nr:hypothetical protein KFK09_014560 [Dendrobium nobile]
MLKTKGDKVEGDGTKTSRKVRIFDPSLQADQRPQDACYFSLPASKQKSNELLATASTTRSVVPLLSSPPPTLRRRRTVRWAAVI